MSGSQAWFRDSRRIDFDACTKKKRHVSDRYECGNNHFLKSLCKLKVRRIRSDNDTEFKNNLMAIFCLKKGIHQEFSAPYTPQQNGVAERKNKTLIDTARTMLSDAKLPITFWAELLIQLVTPCSLLLQHKDRQSKFHAKSVEGIFLGYVANSPCKRVYNTESRTVKEWFKVDYSKYSSPLEPAGLVWGFDYDNLFKSFNLPDLSAEDAAKLYQYCSGENNSNFSTRTTVPIPSRCSDVASASGTHESDTEEDTHTKEDGAQIRNEVLVDPIYNETSLGVNDMGEIGTNLETNIQETIVPETRIHKNHPIENIIGDPNVGVQTRHKTIKHHVRSSQQFLSQHVKQSTLLLQAAALRSYGFNIN
ncbi:hypothetical protein L1987_53055 [Smallanthus sonchifolius]|uniref:Uncharacterized protein n=1 Tax=Smallanthus sonchifolius TaxID=185202 RepID=A0ACB9EVM4_9ASTR|nr:hypothetical protein L1987_53055 [Smallanthus sonchifolius]